MSQRSLYSTPDGFSLEPLLSLLPSIGDVAKLDKFSSSFFARHEAVSKQMHDKRDEESLRHLQVEEAMLKLVLEWLSMKTEG